MKYLNRILLILVLVYSCFSAIIFIRFLPEYLFFHPIKNKWTLVWEDKFNNPTLDETQWMVINRGGGYVGYGSYQSEISAISHENATVKKSCLILAIKEREWIGEDIFHPGQTVAGHYTSGQIVTKHAYAWGRYEIRAKLPDGQGSAYASLEPFDGDSSQKIIIMGISGNDPHNIYMSNHWGLNQQFPHLKEDISSRSYGLDYSAGFHTYAIEIEPGKIRWYIDNVKKYQTKRNIPNIPLFLNLGTVGSGLKAPKLNERNTSLPQYFVVDWVRVYRRK